MIYYILAAYMLISDYQVLSYSGRFSHTSKSMEPKMVIYKPCEALTGMALHWVPCG
jgi:hypothetical protein